MLLSVPSQASLQEHPHDSNPGGSQWSFLDDANDKQSMPGLQRMEGTESLLWSLPPNLTKTSKFRKQRPHQPWLGMVRLCWLMYSFPFKVFWASNFWIFIFKAFIGCYTWETDGLLWNLNNPKEPSEPLGRICVHAFLKSYIIYIRDLDGSLGWVWWSM